MSDTDTDTRYFFLFNSLFIVKRHNENLFTLEHMVNIKSKMLKCCKFEGDCMPNGSTGKVATGGALIYS